MSDPECPTISWGKIPHFDKGITGAKNGFAGKIDVLVAERGRSEYGAISRESLSGDANKSPCGE